MNDVREVPEKGKNPMLLNYSYKRRSEALQFNFHWTMGDPTGIRHGVSLQEYSRFLGMNMIHIFIGNQNGGRGSTSTSATVFGMDSREGGGGDSRVQDKHGQLKDALLILAQSLFPTDQQGMVPYMDSYVSALHESISMKALADRKRVHIHIMKSSFKPNIFVGNTLVNMYAKCGSMKHAHQVFTKMSERNAFSWNAMITGYTQHGHDEKAIELFRQMQVNCVKPNELTLISVLKACAHLAYLEQGTKVHAQIIKSGLESNVFVGSTLIDMYAKCGSIEHARQVFNKMPEKNVVSWTTMIAAYSQPGYAKESLKLFQQMQEECVKPNAVTFVSVLKACARLDSLGKGKQIHAYIIKSMLESDVFVGSALIDMYVKCGSIQHARQVFDQMPERNVVSWTSMISGYANHRYGEEALKLFSQMQWETVKPDDITFVIVLKACAGLAALEQGKDIHVSIIKSGFEADVFVGNALVDMYAKCGSIEHAYQVFNQMPEHDIVSWNAMFSGYAQHGHDEEALNLFQQMQWESMKPDDVTFVSILKACANLSTLERGKQIHAHIIKSGFESDVFVGSALVDMYAKCGAIEHAWHLFVKMPKRNVVSWNVMIAGYAQHGHGKEALQLVEKMQQEGLTLDHFTFIGVLSACNHVGLLDEGCYYFNSMHCDHNISPAGAHYTCMVDLLGRAGWLDDAEDFVKKMTIQPAAVVLMALLGACRVHGNVELAKHTAECLLELEPQNAAAFVLLSNTYSAVSGWDDKVKVRKMMEDRGLKKEPGCSSIEVNSQLHAFIVEDT